MVEEIVKNVNFLSIDVVDAPYSFLLQFSYAWCGGYAIQFSLWRIHHIKHNTPPR